jgi:hypothetical protein
LPHEQRKLVFIAGKYLLDLTILSSCGQKNAVHEAYWQKQDQRRTGHSPIPKAYAQVIIIYCKFIALKGQYYIFEIVIIAILLDCNRETKSLMGLTELVGFLAITSRRSVAAAKLCSGLTHIS